MASIRPYGENLLQIVAFSHSFPDGSRYNLDYIQSLDAEKQSLSKIPKDNTLHKATKERLRRGERIGYGVGIRI